MLRLGMQHQEEQCWSAGWLHVQESPSSDAEQICLQLTFAPTEDTGALEKLLTLM